MRRALIRVSGAKQQWTEFTDGEGRFQFASPVRGEYRLAAHRDGFSDRYYKVELSDFNEGQDLPIELRPQGLITGKVVDGSGSRLARLPRRKPTTGRVSHCGLKPGVYRVRATHRDGRESELDPNPLKVATALFGGAEQPSELVVKSGSVTTGIAFVLEAALPAKIRGTLRSEAGPVTERVTLWIAGQAGEGGHNGSGADGKFEIGDAAPGSYLISARTLGETARLYGSTTVSVGNADVNGVEILLRPSAKVEGRIQWEGAAGPVQASRRGTGILLRWSISVAVAG